MSRKRIGRSRQKDLESTTSLSNLGKMGKARSRKSIRNTKENFPLDSSDLLTPNTQLSKRISGQNLNLPPGKLKKQLEEVLSLIPQTRSSLTKFETIQEAEEFKGELEKYLPKDFGVTIIRKSEVNCYEIIDRRNEDKEVESIRQRQTRKAFHARLKTSPKVEKEIKRAFQRAYFGRKNKADKISKGLEKAKECRTKK